MTQDDFLALLNRNMKGRFPQKPDFEVRVAFGAEEERHVLIDALIQTIESELENREDAALEFYGIDEDYREGDCYIRCEENASPLDIAQALTTIIRDQEKFRYLYVTAWIRDEKGVYRGEHTLDYCPSFDWPPDNDPEPPVPEGVDLDANKGCMGPMSALILLASIAFIFAAL